MVAGSCLVSPAWFAVGAALSGVEMGGGMAIKRAENETLAGKKMVIVASHTPAHASTAAAAPFRA